MKTNKLLPIIFFTLLITSCAAGNNNIGSNMIMQERYKSMEAERTKFTVNLIPPEGGTAIWEGKVLEMPYSVRVMPKKTYQIEIDTPNGMAYRGSIKVVGKGGSIGRFQGYDIRLSGYIIQMLKHERQVSFYLNSPSGKQILLVTFYAP